MKTFTFIADAATDFRRSDRIDPIIKTFIDAFPIFRLKHVILIASLGVYRCRWCHQNMKRLVLHFKGK